MWRFMAKWGTVVLIVSCAFVGFQLIRADAVGQSGSTSGSIISWAGADIVLDGEVSREVIPSTSYSCPGRTQPIAVHKWAGLQEACVYGQSGKLQLARFVGTSGQYVHAVAFPYDKAFTVLRGLCESPRWCAYGQAEDVLAVQLGTAVTFVRDFSRNLEYRIDQGEGNHYFIATATPSPYVMKGGSAAHTKALAVSPHGRWALVEVVEYGFVLVDLRTLDARRVIAPSSQYGYGTDPTYEMAISNDGKKVAIMGLRSGLEVYEVTDGCGDVLTDSSSRFFSPYIQSCQPASIRVYDLFPSFYDAHQPVFSSDGMRLTVYVRTIQQTGFVTLTPAQLKKSGGELRYTALGDSYTSGEGELDDMFYLPSTNIAANRCHVSIRSYPYLIGKAWNIPTVNRACSGAKIKDARLVSQAVARGTSVDDAPTHMSVSIGGNDLDIVGKLKTCLTVGVCEWAKPERRQSSAEEVRQFFPKVVSFIGELKNSHPGVALSIVGYPSVVNTTTNASCPLLTETLLSQEERLYLEETIKYLNIVLRSAAHYSKVPYIDIEQALVGERLCDAHETAMNSIRFGDDIAPLSFLKQFKLFGNESFHPTPRGHELEAQAIVQSHQSIWQADDCASCQFSQSDLSPSSYWTIEPNANQTGGVSSFIRQLAGDFLSTISLRLGDVVSVMFPAGSFPPLSTVRFELHSEPEILAELVVSEDGSLTGSLTIPNHQTGYHTMHAYGTSVSGDAIDIYQTVSIEDPKSAQNTQSPQVGHTSVGNSSNSGNTSHYSPSGGVSNGGLVNDSLKLGATRVATGTVASLLSPMASEEVAGAFSANNTPAINTLYWVLLGVLATLITAILIAVSWCRIKKKRANYGEVLP